MRHHTHHAKTGSAFKFILPVILVILAVAVFGYLSKGGKSLDAPIVKGVLDHWVAKYNEMNSDQALSYGGLEMAGGVSDRHALVKNVLVEVDGIGADGDAIKVQIKAPEVKIMPKDIGFESFDVSVTQGLELIDDEHSVSIAFQPPLVTRMKQVSAEGANVALEHHTPLAGTWRFNTKSIDDTDEDSETVTMVLGENSSASGEYSQGKKTVFNTVYTISSVVITPHYEDEAVMTIGETNLKVDWVESEGEQAAGKLTLQIADMFSDEQSMPLGAVTARADIDYSGPSSQLLGDIDFETQKMLLDIHELSLSTDEYRFSLKGNLQTGRGDILPIGQGQFDVPKFAQLVAMIDERFGVKADKGFEVMIKQMTGKEIAQVKDLSIPLKRVDGGQLQIGNSTLEELFLIHLTGGQMLPGQSAPAMPQPEPQLDEEQIEELFNE